MTIAHASINAWRTYIHPLLPIYRDGVATPDYVHTIRDESYTLRARSVRGGLLSPASPSDRLVGVMSTSMLSSAKRKAAEQDGKVRILF